QTLTKNLVMEGRGTVAGFVFDSSGQRPIPGAMLQLHSAGVVETNLFATAGANGDFLISGVPQGDYIITAKKDLLAAQVTGKISFDGQRLDQSIVLQPCMKISGTFGF